MSCGRLLSKRNYIDRKLKEIEKELLYRGWIEEGWDAEVEETNEDDEPIESAGALIPYRDEVNKKLDFFESIVRENLRPTTTPQFNSATRTSEFSTRNDRPTSDNVRYTQNELKNNLNNQFNNLFN